MKRTAVAASILALVGVTALVGCSNSSTSSETTTAASASAQAVGGTAVCDEASLRTALEDDIAASTDAKAEKIYDIADIQCDEGWAVAFPDVGDTAEHAVTITQVLQAEGQFWLVKDRGDVCGTLDDSDITKRPDDAQVPAGIWEAACTTN